MERQITKRIISILLAVMMLIGTGVTAFAAGVSKNSGEFSWGDDIDYKIEGTTMKITGSGKIVNQYASRQTSLGTVANKYRVEKIEIGEGITEIGDHVFHAYGYTEKQYLIEVVLPSTLTKIGNTAFGSCNALEKINIQGVTELGQGSFVYCKKLSDIGGFNKDLKTIPTQAFMGCGFTSIEIPSTVNSVDRIAFSECANLTDLKIECRNVKDAAFGNLSMLKNVTFGNDVINVDENAFSRCTALEKIQIPDNVNLNSYFIFSGCTNLREVTLPNNMTELTQGMFQNCTSLETITIPESVKTISTQAFESCTSLREIYIPKNVETIVDNAFNNCKSLAKIEVDKDNKKYDSRDNCNAIIKKKVTITENDTMLVGCKYTVVPENVDVDSNSFYGKDLRTLYIRGVEHNFHNNPFYGCKSFTDVYYKGSSDDWENKISIDSWSNPLANNEVKVHYGWDGVAPKTVKVTFDSKGGSVLPSASIVRVGETISLPTPKKDDNKCLGWATTSTATKADYVCGARYEVKAETILYAVWQNNTTTNYTVTFNANGGSVSPASATVESGKTTTLPTPTRSGYTCLGWATTSTATTAAYACGARYEVKAETTLYAVWQNNTTTNYTVTFNANGGSVSPASATVESGKTTTLPTPTRSGYTCLGWATTSTATTATYACGASYKPTANTTLYAVWKKTASEPVVIESGDVICSYTSGAFGTSDSGLQLKVTEYQSGTTELSTFQTAIKNGDVVAAYSIKVVDGSGKVCQPQNGQSVTVKIQIPDGIKTSDNIFIYHKKSDGTSERIKMDDGKVKFENGYIVFETTSFSDFVVCKSTSTTPTISVSDALNLNYKKSAVLKATTENADGYTVKYVSSDTKVATVDENGTVTAVKRGKGTATITANLVDAKGNVVASDTCKVNVSLTFGQKLIVYVLFGWLWY